MTGLPWTMVPGAATTLPWEVSTAVPGLTTARPPGEATGAPAVETTVPLAATILGAVAAATRVGPLVEEAGAIGVVPGAAVDKVLVVAAPPLLVLVKIWSLPSGICTSCCPGNSPRTWILPSLERTICTFCCGLPMAAAGGAEGTGDPTTCGEADGLAGMAIFCGAGWT